MIKVRSFDDQDGSRFAVARLTARAVEDILYVLDSATAPSGSAADDASAQEVEAYREFREWFGPQVGAAIQGLVVGPLINSLEILDDGLANVRYEERRAYVEEHYTEEDRTRSRLIWLAEEIPSLIETYEQLQPDEVQVAEGVCRSIWSLVQGVYDHELAVSLLPDAEKWFMFSQPGAKILRGDKEAIAALLELTDRLREEVNTFEEKRKRAKDAIEAGRVDDEDRDYAQDELSRVESEILRHEETLAELDKKRRKIQKALENG